MKNLKDFINESISSRDEKLFWKWIEALGETDMISKINKKGDGEPLYEKASELETTKEQFEIFCDIFYSFAGNILSIIENDDDNGMSDDGCQYASWSAPFYGEKQFKKALKSKNWTYICDQHEGEECGYAMDVDLYDEYLEDKGLNPKGFK